MKVLKIICLIAFFVLAGTIFIHSLDSINQDIGRHLKTGEIIWQTGHVPKINLFSYTEPNIPFINHHWLSEVIFYLLNIYIGLKGLIVFKAGILLVTFWLLWQAVSKKVEPLLFAVAGLTGLLIILDRTDVRPEIFSYLFLAYFLFAIFQAKYSQKYTWLYTAPLVQLAWTNMHIYFILGPTLLLLFLIDRFFENKRNPKSETLNPKQYQNLKAIFVLTLLITLLNPNGIYGAIAPLTILNNYGYSIVENQSILFLKNYGILLTQINIFVLATLLFWLSFIPALKKYGLKGYIFEIGAGLAFTILGFDMIRNLGPYTIVYIPILALNLQAWLSPILINRKILIGIYTALIVVFLFLLNTVVSNDFYRWAGSGNQFGLEISAGAENGVNFVKNNKLAGPVFNNFDVGSYLIWKLYPEFRVFVDGRPEAYTLDFFQKIYIPMQEDPTIWKHYADDIYHINYVFFDYHDITPWAQTFLSFISQDKNWPLVYKDNSIVIFLRRTSQNLPIIQKLVAI
ncbi:MAG: hypothetical protein AAB374_01825 [Patescibacteria group bacterium]